MASAAECLRQCGPDAPNTADGLGYTLLHRRAVLSRTVGQPGHGLPRILPCTAGLQLDEVKPSSWLSRCVPLPVAATRSPFACRLARTGLRDPLWAFLSAGGGSVDLHRRTLDGSTARQLALVGGHAEVAALLDQLVVRLLAGHITVDVCFCR